MTLTTRSLALLTACALFYGCSEDAAQNAAAPPRNEVKLPAPNVAADKKAEAPHFAATAPDSPPSLVDSPKSSAPAPDAREQKPMEQTSLEPKPLEPKPLEAKQPSDFDRALDPAEVQIDRFVLATGVTEREPVGESDVFTSDTKEIFAFVQFANPNPPFALRVHWEKAEGPTFPYGFKLEVPTAARFRTWSWTRIKREPGHYRAVLRTLEGEEVASREFAIVAGDQL